MTDHKCGTCKHWRRNNYYPGFGDCRLLRDEGHELAKLVCDDDYGLNFLTKPEFGCVLWEKQDP